MYQPKFQPIKPNPAGENNRAPSPMAKEKSYRNMGKSSGNAGGTVNPRQIPTTMGFTGKRIKK